MRKQHYQDWEIAVLGAGTMGLCIAQLFAMHGHQVSLYNRTPANLEKALAQIESNLHTLLELEQISEKDIPAVLANIHGSSDLKEAVVNADMIVENVAEHVDVKREIFAKLDTYCSEDVIFASDTSTMNVFEFLNISHPERLIITHFFNPAYVMPLVELVKGPETSEEIASEVKAFLESVGKTVAVLNKVIPGFILNRITTSVLREACYIAEQGVASYEDIDKAIVAIFGPRYAFEGPFRLGDFVGIDVYERLGILLPPVLSSDSECPAVLKELTAQGKFGVKAGEGFFRYEDPAEARRVRDTTYLKMIRAIHDVKASIENV